MPLTWQAKDVLMLDNKRSMHGRYKIEYSGQRYVITYFGYIKFAKLGEEKEFDTRWRKIGGLQAIISV